MRTADGTHDACWRAPVLDHLRTRHGEYAQPAARTRGRPQALNMNYELCHSSNSGGRPPRARAT